MNEPPIALQKKAVIQIRMSIFEVFIICMGEKTCIRVLADAGQIKQCRCKIEEMEPSLMLLAKAFDLVGNEVRIKILFLLHQEGQLCPCDLSDILRMNVSAISQHLRKLKDANVVQSKKTGQTIFYFISPEYTHVLKPVFKLLNDNKVLQML